MSDTPYLPSDVLAALSAPFELDEVKWKPAVVSGNRAMAIAYVDARVVQDRLDDVLGVAGWQDSYKVLPDGSVICRLRARLGEQWITKMDVGSQSEQPDGGDRTKAAFSDALKRAAVKFGVGRYLYRLPSQWVDYDPQKRQFRATPQFPAWAISNRPTPSVPASGATDETVGEKGARFLRDLAERKGATLRKLVEPYLSPHAGLETLKRSHATAVRRELEAMPDRPAPAGAPQGDPLTRYRDHVCETSAELHEFIEALDAKLAAEGRAAAGAVVQHLLSAAVVMQMPGDWASWTPEQIRAADQMAREFAAKHREKKTP